MNRHDHRSRSPSKDRSPLERRPCRRSLPTGSLPRKADRPVPHPSAGERVSRRPRRSELPRAATLVPFTPSEADACSSPRESSRWDGRVVESASGTPGRGRGSISPTAAIVPARERLGKAGGGGSRWGDAASGGTTESVPEAVVVGGSRALRPAGFPRTRHANDPAGGAGRHSDASPTRRGPARDPHRPRGSAPGEGSIVRSVPSPGPHRRIDSPYTNGRRTRGVRRTPPGSDTPVAANDGGTCFPARRREYFTARVGPIGLAGRSAKSSFPPSRSRRPTSCQLSEG